MTPAVRSIRRRAPAQDIDLGDAHWPRGMSPLLRRVHAARGSGDGEAALPKLASLLPPDGLLGIDEAVRLLRSAISDGRHIVVVGDFDADGATATALGVRGLRLLGARRISHAVPNRVVHGYGLSPALVEELAALQPDLLVTVDHGIACHAGIEAARARGWQVLVTDHHLPGASLPPADAIVNPNQPGDGFASKALAEAITPANYETGLELLRECDLIIEAIAERMDWKQDLYRKIAAYVPAHAVLASNTSGLGINKLADVLPEELRPRFCGVHFFNPPRYMHLAELIPAKSTEPEVLEGLETFLTTTLGKGVVYAKDTPNFIGNRIGVFIER